MTCLFRPFARCGESETELKGVTLERLLIRIDALTPDKQALHFWYKCSNMSWFATFVWFFFFFYYRLFQWVVPGRKISYCNLKKTAWQSGKISSVVAHLCMKMKQWKTNMKKISNKMRPSGNTHLGRKFGNSRGEKTISSMAVLLNVINQCTKACEMEDSGRVQYSSQREQLRPRQSYDVSFILSVWCLASSLLRAPSLSLIPPLSGLVRSPVEAVMKPSSLHHTQLSGCLGITQFNDAFSHNVI